MIGGIYTPDINTISVADTYISDNAVVSQMPVCLVCASTKDTFKIEVSDDDGNSWTAIADLDASVAATFDYLYYVTNKGTQVKLTGTGFLRVQGNLVPVV